MKYHNANYAENRAIQYALKLAKTRSLGIAIKQAVHACNKDQNINFKLVQNQVYRQYADNANKWALAQKRVVK